MVDTETEVAVESSKIAAIAERMVHNVNTAEHSYLLDQPMVSRYYACYERGLSENGGATDMWQAA